MIKEVNAHGGQVNTTYNTLGQVTSVTNPFTSGGTPSSYVTSYSYDTLGRTTTVTLPDNNTVQTSYSGLAVTVTDQVNRKIKREMDSLGRLVKVTEQDVSTGTLNQETTYTYNLLDKLTQVNQGNQYRKYKYDDLSRLLYEKIPEQTETINDPPGNTPTWTTQYTYNQFSQVTARLDARGVTTNYTYDGLNRLTQITYNVGSSGVSSTPQVTFNYDTTQGSLTNGLLTGVVVGGGRTTDYEEVYAYGSFNRLSSITHWIANKSYTTSYQYNQSGQMTKLTYPSGYYYYLNHDTKGRVQALSQAQGQNNGSDYLNNVTYSITGQLAGLGLGNGVTESYTYSADRLQMTNQTASKGATSLMNLTYSYSASAGQNGSLSTAGNSGQLMSISGSINSTTESAAYTYDNLSRLVSSNQTTNGTTAYRKFVYDRWGNRTAVWSDPFSVNQIQSISLTQSGGAPTNRLTSVTNSGSTVSYTYDNNGNVINDGVHTFQYDAENRVVSVDNGSTATYAYDHQNRRVKKTVGSTTTHCVWQGNYLFSEHNGSTGALLINYTYAGSRMISKVDNGTTRYFLSDPMSARVVLDVSGNVVGRQAHLPFGEDLNASGTTDKHKFTSYERDNESGMDYAINRFDNNSIGRFNRVDPLGSSGKKENPQSWNRYTYTKNDPVNMRDPMGLDDFSSGSEFPGIPDPEPCRPFGPDLIWDAFSGPIDRFTYCFLSSGPIPATKDPVSKPTCADTINEMKLRFTDDQNLMAAFAFFEMSSDLSGDISEGIAIIWVARNRLWFLHQNITSTHGFGPRGGSLRDVLGYNDPNGGKQFPEFKDDGELTPAAQKRLNRAMAADPADGDCQLLYKAYLAAWDVYVNLTPDPFASQGGSWYFNPTSTNPQHFCTDCIGPLGRLGGTNFFTFPFINYIQ